MNNVRRSSITVDNLTSPVLEAGDTTASEAVVFVHGSPGCGAEFERLVGETGEFTRAIAIDMPGFGAADKPHPREFIYDVPNMGIHLARAVDQLGVTRVHWVGHDFGGAWSLLAAVFDPLKTVSISMINSGMMRGMRWHRLARVYRTPLLGEAFMGVANKQGFQRTLSELPQADLDLMWDNFDRDTRRAILALYRATDMEAQTAQLPQLRLLSQQWQSIVIFGADDPFLPARFAERNKEALVNAEVHLIEGAGHWPHLEAPETVSGLLEPFLRQAQSRPAHSALA
ncbi:MAG: alpha/beta hydrolase [Solirubrobacterales bacterium]